MSKVILKGNEYTLSQSDWKVSVLNISYFFIAVGSEEIWQGLQILLMSGFSVTSASQILESFWNIWSQVSQRKKPNRLPAHGPGMYTLSWGIHEVAVAVCWPGKLKSMMAFDRNLPSSSFVVQYNSLISMI